MSEKKSCSGNCGGCESAGRPEECALQECLRRIDHKIMVMSGKGGVGKSTVSVNLAMALAMEGKRVGLLDVDMHGPSIPKMLHLEEAVLHADGGRLQPVEINGILVMSIGFMLHSPDQAVIWRGPMKIGIIKQLLSEVEWGDLDYLIIDCPPGTGDEPLSVCQMIPDADGAIIVTTPQQVAAADVSRSLNFCSQLSCPVIGLIENMSGFACPHCQTVTDIFASGAGEQLAAQYGIPLLGKIPLDPAICRGGDDGRPFIHHYAGSATAKAFAEAILPILRLSDRSQA